MHKQTQREIEKALKTWRAPSRLTDKAIHHYLAGLDTPRALTVWLLYESGEHQQLVDLEVEPETYVSNRYLARWRGPIAEPLVRGAEQFRNDYLATCLLSKSDFLDLGVDTAEVAMSKWAECEEALGLTNTFLRGLSFRRTSMPKDGDWLLNAVIQKIQRILGEFDPVEWFESCSWGPGATFHKGGTDTSPVNKFQTESGITPSLYHFVKTLIPSWSPLWWDQLRSNGFNFVAGNRVITVPKNAKTDRVIAVEPGLNVFFQLGIGRMIMRRLKATAGIDLKTQDRNGLLCYFASASGSLATVDFSSASDRISRELVRLLLPPVWYEVLDSCRSKFSYVEGYSDAWVEQQKFSSMGNGFTFPLQSLIFFAIAEAVCEKNGVSSEYVGVFGDDVILPTASYQTYLEFCGYLGFKVNREKSFSTGWFRESCGTHYFRGLDVKPVYLKTRLKDVLDVIKLANAVRRVARRYGRNTHCDKRFFPTWFGLYNSVPNYLRFQVSEGYGDCGFIDNFDAATPPPKRVSGRHPQCEGFFTKAFAVKARKKTNFDVGMLLARLFSSSEFEEGNEYPLRSASRPYVSRLWVHRWYDLGLWG